jgi:putative transposase
MKASKFSDAQRRSFFGRALTGFPSPTSVGRLGSARRPISIGRRSMTGMQPPEMLRLKQLEDENAKLKKIGADLSLDRETLQDVIRQNSEACSQARAGDDGLR